jgi:transcriptional regulator with XRE-family HTH domain
MSELGDRLRELRLERSLTLVEMGKLCDVAVSTLSKIENGQVSPVYGTLHKIALGLGVAFESLVSGRSREASGARRAVTQQGEAKNFGSERYTYSMHAADLISKAMVPLVMEIVATDAPVDGDWSSHEGEEFIYVLEGKVAVHLEHYAPVELMSGESIYIDSRMRHGFVRAGKGRTRLLSVTYDPAQLTRSAFAADRIDLTAIRHPGDTRAPVAVQAARQRARRS